MIAALVNTRQVSVTLRVGTEAVNKPVGDEVR